MTDQNRDKIKTFEDDGFEEVLPDSVILGVGEFVRGQVKGFIPMPDDTERELLVLKTAKGTKTIPVSSVLEKKLKNVKEGDTIIIVRDDDIISNQGRTVKSYRVFIRKG